MTARDPSDQTMSLVRVYLRRSRNPEKAHRNGNARFTIFTKDEDIEIKWLKSKVLAVKKSKKC